MGYSSDSDCNRFYAPKDSRDWGSTVSYAESHDEQRMAYKQDQWAVDGVKGNLDNSMRRLGSVAAQMILSPGAHMIWQFGELGNGTNTKNPSGDNNTDPKPVYWDYYNVDARRGLYDNYSELIWLRKKNPELFTQDATFSISCGTSNWANGRFIYSSIDNKELICVINPNNAETTISGVTFKSKNNSDYTVASSSYGVDYTFDASTGSVKLQAGSYVVIVNDKVAGVDDAISDFGTQAIVAGGHGEIIITGDYNKAEIYNVSGQQFHSTNVPAGMYIVNVDGKATKVIVR